MDAELWVDHLYALTAPKEACEGPSPEIALSSVDPLLSLHSGTVSQLFLFMLSGGQRLKRPDRMRWRHGSILLSNAPHHTVGYHADQKQLQPN